MSCATPKKKATPVWPAVDPAGVTKKRWRRYASGNAESAKSANAAASGGRFSPPNASPPHAANTTSIAASAGEDAITSHAYVAAQNVTGERPARS